MIRNNIIPLEEVTEYFPEDDENTEEKDSNEELEEFLEEWEI